MTERASKKRKLSVEAAENEYTFKPIRLRTINEDIEAVPYDILQKALLNLAKKDLNFIVKLNTEIQRTVDPRSLSKSGNSSQEESKPSDANEEDNDDDGDNEDESEEDAIEYGSTNELNLTEEDAREGSENNFELAIYSPEKIRDHIESLFDNNTWFEDYGHNYNYNGYEGADDRIKKYDTLIEGLDELLAKAKTLAQVGETASAYIILRVLKEEIDENKFDSNGDLEEEDMSPTPSEWIDKLEMRFNKAESGLNKEEYEYCKKRLAMYEDEKPTADNNAFVIVNFPLTKEQVKNKFIAQIGKASDYIGKFQLKSTIKTLDAGNQYQIHATTNAQSRSGYYKETLVFDNKTLIKYECSCPVGNSCKHTAGLMLQICKEKEDLLRALAPTAPISNVKNIYLPSNVPAQKKLVLGKPIVGSRQVAKKKKK